jgi:hypothetical protein
MVSVSRGRLPSFDVQRETRAALAAAIESKLLPATFGDIDGLIVTEKNSFIHITEASDEFPECDQDLLRNWDMNLKESARNTSKEGTNEGQLRERSGSLSLGSKSRRCSCPPKLDVVSPTSGAALDSRTQAVSSSLHVSPSFRGRRHYSVDLNNNTTTPSNRSSPSSPLKPVDETSASTLPDTPVEIKTTVMLRNIPYSEGQLGVLSMIEERGFAGRFDFFYAPLDFSSANNLGYAFVNFPDPEAVSEFFAVFDGLRVAKEGWSQKDLQVCWARVQGLHPNVEHYRNSPVNDMPENFRPMIFDANGRQLPFPRPDENLLRRPVPSTSIYSGSRAANRPRFASAHYPSNSGLTTAARRRNPAGSFHRSQ